MSLDFSWLGDPLYQLWLVRGTEMTLLLSALGSVLALALGIAGVACIHLRIPVLAPMTTLLVELFRNTPPLVQLFFLYFTLTEIGLRLFNPATGRYEPVFSGVTCVALSLGLYNGAIAVEVLRAGLIAVPAQTVEGARSLGYSRAHCFRAVELPIALRLSVPAMTNNLVSLVKTSAQASLVAVADAMYYATQIMLENFRNLEVMLLVWVIYLAIASAVAWAMRIVGRSWRMPGFGA